LNFENFSGGIAHRPPYWGGYTVPLPRPHPLNALFLPHLAEELQPLHNQEAGERTRVP